MLILKRFAAIPKRRAVTEEDRDYFKTVGFDPEELIQLKDMSETELKYLMVFCGIRVFNGMPLSVLEEDEMRMAYVIWRSEKIQERKNEIASFVERGDRCLKLVKKVLQHMTH